MNFDLRGLIKSRFIKNVVMVASGTAGAQIIGMAFSPVITRLYGAESIGLLGVFVSAIAIVAPVSALTYPIAVVLGKREKEAVTISHISLFFSFLVALLVLLILLLWKAPILSVLNAGTISDYVFLIPFAIIFSSLLQIMEQWMIREKLFKLTAQLNVFKSAMVNVFKVVGGIVNPQAIILIIITTLGSGLHAMLLGLGLKHKKGRAFIGRMKFWQLPGGYRYFRDIAWKYRDFPFYRAPQVLINSLSKSLPIIMLSGFFGPAAAGYYSIAKMVLGVPSQLIGKSVSNVFYPKITEIARKGEVLTGHVLKATGAMALVGIIPFLLVIFFGPWLFEFVFGDEWAIAGVYARWLSLMYFFGFINKPCVAVAPVLKAQGWLFFYELVSTGTKILGLGIGFLYFKNDVIAVTLFSILGAAAYIWLILALVNKSRKTIDYHV